MSDHSKKSNFKDVQLDNVVKDLTIMVEKEVKAFSSLFEVLLQQGLLIPSKIENKESGLGPYTEKGKRILKSQIVPRVERQYVQRLSELKDILTTLSDKIKNTNKQNHCRLEKSLKTVNNCLYVLEQGHIIDSHQNENQVNSEISSCRGAE